jgi:aquaporin Z
MSLMKRCSAEFLGTLWLVLGGCGSAVIAANYSESGLQQVGNAASQSAASQAAAVASATSGIGVLGVAIAFGLTVLTMAYAIGHISGCHLNPAVSFGLWAGKRFPGSDLLPYIVSQVSGAIVAAGIIFVIASGKVGFDLSGKTPLATNGFANHSPAGYSLLACFVTEVVMTFFFLMIIMGATDRRAPQGFAPIAIGLGLTLVHLISIPVTNTSVNPARSTGVAIFAGAEMFSQVWLFWVAPILGALVAGWAYNAIFERDEQRVEETV